MLTNQEKKSEISEQGQGSPSPQAIPSTLLKFTLPEFKRKEVYVVQFPDGHLEARLAEELEAIGGHAG